MKTSFKSIAMKVTLLLRTLVACLIVAAFSFAAIPTRAGDAEADAKQAFENLKAAMAKVDKAKEDLDKAQKALDKGRAETMKDGKVTADEEALLQNLANQVAEAEAALKAAEDEFYKALRALEDALEKLPDGNEVKKELKRQRDILLGSRFGNSRTQVVTANGLRTLTFGTLYGQVIVNLPDDMRAGDTISGTVMAAPKGQTPAERTNNMAVLTGCVIEIERPKKADGTSNPKVTAQVTAALSPFTFTLPPSSAPTPTFKSVSSGSSGGLGITLTNVSGSFFIGGTTTVPIEIISLSLQSVAPVQLPTIAQQGKPVEIQSGNRSFDGKSATTNCKVAGQDVLILAESPSKVVFESPTNVTGPVEIILKEGNQETKGTYRNVGVNLTAPKTSLLKGESTELRIQVSGLEGIKEPVPLTLECKGVITMEGGPYQQLVIQPSQVGADGSYTTTPRITGVQAGGWNATATVVTHRFDVCLQDDSVPARVILVNTFSGNYSKTCCPCPFLPNIAKPPGGTSLSGKGTITTKGCILTLEHNAPDRRVMVRIDQCTHTGSASVQAVSPKIKFTIIDRNTANNTCAVP